LSRYAQYVAAARAIESPNSSDDEWVKLAMAGFSSHVGLEQWTREDFDSFVEIRRSEFTDEVLGELGPEAVCYERFGCICIGAILAQMRLGAIRGPEELFVALAAVAGFMALHSPDISALEAP
jgi:hypothetical protein